ncbi:hypothetical protein BJ322DRAFT_783159 [Thelephora terrestris]|uniref:Uncharacterized protein n=1 Tax=Thelephora terrestris TaxID=56493 RepID=A0A9P6HG08_9AGAM|nr:hypothetical protein BJ322DRAFT_783159 [Thelephora terrestris]
MFLDPLSYLVTPTLPALLHAQAVTANHPLTLHQTTHYRFYRWPALSKRAVNLLVARPQGKNLLPNPLREISTSVVTKSRPSGVLIRKLPFQRLVRELAQDFKLQDRPAFSILCRYGSSRGRRGLTRLTLRRHQPCCDPRQTCDHPTQRSCPRPAIAWRALVGFLSISVLCVF